jgi:signal transduction histidine kinase
VIAVPAIILGLLLVLSALTGARVAGRRRGAVVTVLLSPLHPSTWYAVAAIGTGFLVEAIAFLLVVGFFSSGASTLLVGIGVVFIGVGIEIARAIARSERARATWADARPLVAHPYRRTDGGPRDLLMGTFLDINRWRDVLYVLVAFPLTALELAVALSLWTATIGLLAVPGWALIGESLSFAIPGVSLPMPAVAAAAGLLGVLLLPVSATVTRGLVWLHRAVVAGLLCTSATEALEQRVETLEVSRQAVLDVEASELRRIERDLHDGAQQRLVMLTIQLGRAEERIETDPQGARVLVADARDQARLALAEIRDLVRGIAPAILMDRGLVPALGALAGRSPVPTGVTSLLPDGLRLPEAAERAAYFAVAEALANAAKHSGAARCEIRCRTDGPNLVVEVWDNGVGGARILPAGGLAGLVGRVGALDGSLQVESPAGGPTIVRAEIPAFGPAVRPG